MDRHGIKTDSASPQEFIYVYRGGRISVLTEALVRWETGTATDLPTQRIWFRNIASPRFSLKEIHHGVVIATPRAQVEFDLKTCMAFVTTS